MEDVMSKLHQLESTFYGLHSEFCNFRSKVEESVIDEYNYSSIKYKLNQLELNLNTLKQEFEDKLSRLPVQQGLNIYYLEHKDLYDQEFADTYELCYFIRENIFNNQDIKLIIDIYDDNYQITYNSNIDFQLSFLKCKDYLIQVSTLNTGLYGNYCKYCVNKEALIQNIKQKIFDLTMTT